MADRYALSFFVLWYIIVYFFVNQSEAAVSDEMFLELKKLVNSRINELEKTVHSQQMEIKHLQERLIHVEHSQQKEAAKYSSIPSLLKRSTNTLLKTKLNEAVSSPKMREKKVHDEDRNDIDDSKGNNMLIHHRSAQSSSVGFYAYMSRDETNPGKQHTLIFDVMKTNTGNAYNRFSGLFTAPIDGLYVFSCSLAMEHEYASFNVVKNAAIEASFAVDADHNDEWRYTSVTVVLELVQGDIVFVRTSNVFEPIGSIRSREFGRSSFSGWKI